MRAICVVAIVALSAATCMGVTIESGAARIKTVGGAEKGVWNLWTNGQWGDFVHFAKAGTYTVKVKCYGSVCEGVWPEMAFVVDGVTKEKVKVETAKTQEYTFTLKAEAKDYQVAVEFTNDAQTKTEDRNLYVVGMTIEGVGETTLAKEASGISPEEGKKQDEEALARAEKEIEKNRKNDAVMKVMGKDGKPVAGAKVTVELVRHEFLFGANIMLFDELPTKAENDLYKERFKALFNYATTQFYWMVYEKEKGKPDYASTDKIVEWCLANHIRLKGHPLLWSNPLGIPPWSKGQPAKEIQKQRVTDIMKRYTGKIDDWEVVNEADAVQEIAEPYKWAREANPQAQLIVNHFGVMSGQNTRFFGMLAEAEKTGVPFDGIGIQAHEPEWAWFPLGQVEKALAHFATLGKGIYITEFTPESGGGAIKGSPYMKGKWDEATQADYAVKFYTMCFANPAVKAITWWDMVDPGAFRASGGMLHKDLSPKATYTALMKLIHETWSTKANGASDAKGEFKFRGFRGEYTAKITVGGKTVEKEFRVGEGKNEVEVNVGS